MIKPPRMKVLFRFLSILVVINIILLDGALIFRITQLLLLV